MSKRKNKKKIDLIVSVISIVIFALYAAYYMLTEDSQTENNTTKNVVAQVETSTIIEQNNIPEYTGEICIDINDNQPYFKEDEITTESFEIYSNLDDLGRCGVAFANVCKDIMPADGEKRGSISYKPTGWVQTIYNNGQALYNRCHLIAWQLGNENNNKKNLITGTRQMNEAMIPWENAVANYVKEKNKEGKDYHVLYRVTPDFRGNNLVANGVEIEAKSVEDNGEGVCFNKYIYNVQEGFEITYATGENKQIGG